MEHAAVESLLSVAGFETVASVLDGAERRVLEAQVDACGDIRAGARDMLAHAWCRELALRLKRHFGIARRLHPQALAVQCTLFDKSTARNWAVAMHQDLSVPVRGRGDALGFRGWSEKDGVVFVQPPVAVLECLLAVRVHLDDCGSETGALRVVPGSHRHGRLNARRIEQLRLARGEVLCPVPHGGVLLMRPLLLHASAKAVAAAHRRVLHFVFAPPQLPAALEWQSR